MAAASGPKTTAELLKELEPVVAGELDRHLSTAKEWFPHQYVPWDLGRTFDGPLEGEPWSPEDSEVSPAAREALVVNLLTEDNLPGYHREISTIFGRDGAWGTWVDRWTAEENRHSIVIRDYLTVTRAVDPVALERARMAHMQRGYQPSISTTCCGRSCGGGRSSNSKVCTATPTRPARNSRTSWTGWMQPRPGTPNAVPNAR